MSAPGVTPLWKWARANARIRNEYVTETLAEFLGTFVLCLFAVGASAQATLMGGETYLMPVFGGVFGLMIAVTVFGGASGAQINPAVTLGLAIAGETSWAKLPLFWFAQLFGGYLGAGLGYAIYKHALCGAGVSDGDCTRAIGIFSPIGHTDAIGTGMADQVVATAILMMAIMSAIDPRNMKVPKYLYGIFFAFVVAGVAFAFGINAGGVMNPARDLGPRLMAVSLGHDSDIIFKTATLDHYWLVPLFGPLIGAAVGSIMYIFFVGAHLKDEEDSSRGPSRPAESGDWRSTVFIPKANTQAPMTPVAANNPYGNGGPYNAGGMNNNGYVRDDMKPRPIY